MGLFFNKKKRLKTVAFVDYEHWYYSYCNLYTMKPNVEEWLDEIKRDYDCDETYFFGDFSEYSISTEAKRLEDLKTTVIHTANSSEHAKKDFTDFIMLDYIYQMAAEKDCPDIFLIFTGDGHFDSVMKYLRKKLNKKVIVYGVKRAFSGKLKSIANSYVEMPRYVQEQQFYFGLILQSLKALDKRGKKATFWKTIRNVAEHNKVTEERVETSLQELIDRRYLSEVETEYQGKRSKILSVDWNRLQEDGIWEEGTA